jgi:hypothetical protein
VIRDKQVALGVFCPATVNLTCTLQPTLHLMPNLITVDRFTTPWEAHIVRGLLESEGVPAWLADEHQIGANWRMSQAFGGVRLQVPASYHAQALDVLAALRNGEYLSALEAQLQIPPNRCPTCSSIDIRLLRSPSSVAFVIALFLFVGFFFPPAIGGQGCNGCGARFKYSP